jgi:protein-S-isoprenylcysteine O-methyltransferase Ste14
MDKYLLKRIVQTGSNLLLQGMLLFLCAGTLRWTWAWVFMALGLLILAINFRVLPRELVRERARKGGHVEPWDRVMMKVSLIPIVGMYALAGLDYRWGWTGPLPAAVPLAGLLLVLAGAMLFTWSMRSNPFFTTLVRIQAERGHRVASGGPYRYIRHPGYAGYIAMALGTSLALGSPYALIMSFVLIILFIVRTALEDRTLRQKLPGYPEYSGTVRYRLVPSIW